MERSELSVGLKVIFGNGRGEKTLGEIVKINRTRAKVKTLEARGVRRVSGTGAVWTVPFPLITKAPSDAKPQEKAPKAAVGVRDYTRFAADFAKGDRVWFVGRAGKKIVGTVIRVSKKTCSVDPDDKRVPYWRVPPSMLRREGESAQGWSPVKAPKAPRSDVEILNDLRSIEAGLSPENLTCDGELSIYQARRRASKLNAQKKALIKELGRTPTDAEIWGITFA
jgi:hypothetical protein